MMHHLKNDLITQLWGTQVTLPKGTRVRLIKNASGTEGDLFAVDDVKLLIQLTRNSHDPKYRYAFVPFEAVEEVAGNKDHGMFLYHNCWKCKDGKLPCVVGNPSRCENPHAKND